MNQVQHRQESEWISRLKRLEKEIEAAEARVSALEETHNSVSILPKGGESHMNWTKRMLETDEVDTGRLGIDE